MYRGCCRIESSVPRNSRTTIQKSSCTMRMATMSTTTHASFPRTRPHTQRQLHARDVKASAHYSRSEGASGCRRLALCWSTSTISTKCHPRCSRCGCGESLSTSCSPLCYSHTPGARRLSSSDSAGALCAPEPTLMRLAAGQDLATRGSGDADARSAPGGRAAIPAALCHCRSRHTLPPPLR